MRWHGYVTSPFVEDSKVYKCKNNRYCCKYFNVKTGTLLVLNFHYVSGLWQFG